jgi:hypothetical protein
MSNKDRTSTAPAPARPAPVSGGSGTTVDDGFVTKWSEHIAWDYAKYMDSVAAGARYIVTTLLAEAGVAITPNKPPTDALRGVGDETGGGGE